MRLSLKLSIKPRCYCLPSSQSQLILSSSYILKVTRLAEASEADNSVSTSIWANKSGGFQGCSLAREERVLEETQAPPASNHVYTLRSEVRSMDCLKQGPIPSCPRRPGIGVLARLTSTGFKRLRRLTMKPFAGARRNSAGWFFCQHSLDCP